MSLQKEKTKKFAVLACGRAGDGGHERHSMFVSADVALFVDLSLSSLVERGVRCIRVGESAVQLGVIFATSDPWCLLRMNK
jgi:hypothetical protein